MTISKRSLLTGVAALAVAPNVARGSVPDVVTVRTVPPLAGWPDWTPLQPGNGFPSEIQVTADSLQFITPAPGYRFRQDGMGMIVHEPQ